jgi:8-oxo-dGTP pyrophosphatase MutT (NUDIX family)
MDKAPSVHRIERIDLAFEPKPWPFAIERRADIAAFFTDLQRDNPGIWNGRVLLLHRQHLEAGVFRGGCLETDYASFAAWQRWGWAETGVRNCFGAGAIRGHDGGFLLGVMSSGTFNAGQAYFPCGTPDPDDVRGGAVDLDFSVRREIEEETGLATAAFEAEPGWTMVADGGLLAMIKVFRASEAAEALRRRIVAFLSKESRPELTNICIARSAADAPAGAPGYVRAFLESHADAS